MNRDQIESFTRWIAFLESVLLAWVVVAAFSPKLLKFWAWIQNIDQGFGLFLAALFGFVSITFVTLLTHKKIVEREDAARKLLTKSLTRALGAELLTIYKANQACMITAEKSKNEGEIFSDSVRTYLKSVTATGRIFKKTAPSELGLLDTKAVKQLIIFYHLVDYLINSIDGVPDIERVITRCRMANERGKKAALIMDVDLSEEL